MAFRVLNVAEKNDAAKEISRIMSRGSNSRREGFSCYNKIYEYPYYLFNRHCEMVMTSVSGHLMGQEFAAGFSKWLSCAPLSLFQAPIAKTVPVGMQDIRRTLERETRRCNTLIIWTDCDREGENIGFEIIEICKNVKPRIDIYRARFSEITDRSITTACNNLIRPDSLASLAVDVRQELDLRIGAAFTRYQTLRLQKRFPQVLSDQLISYGSCQFPTLGFVVQRYKEILAFVAETFYRITVVHKTDDGDIDFHWKRGRLFHQLACEVLHDMCTENPLATVINQVAKPKSKWRPLPLDTIELEKLGSRKLKINAKETMRIAEKLYSQGFISYPRTETNIFPPSLDLAGLIQHQTVDRNWGPFAQNLLAEGPTPRQGVKTDNAHPPIHPTKYTDNLQGNEKRLYEFIVRHFLACCSKDAQGVETVVDIDIAGEQFTAKGLSITARNYLDVYPYERWADKTLPLYEIGDQFTPTSINMTESETQPPSLLTEADLISLMDKHGIGTDATHAQHIETIKSRFYVGVQPDGTFIPGELGMGLVEGYDAMGFGFSKPELRAQLEADLKRICLGQKDKDVVLQEQIEQYREMFVRTMDHVDHLDQALSQYLGQPEELTEDPVPQGMEPQPVLTCPYCRTNPMILRKTQTDRFMLSCLGFPHCGSKAFFPMFVLNAVVLERVCSRCQPGPVHKIKFTFKRGSVPPMMDLEYDGCVKCDDMLREVTNFRITAGDVGQVRGNQNREPLRGRGAQPRGRGAQARGRGAQARGRGAQARGRGAQARGQGRGNTSQGRGNNRGNGNPPPPWGGQGAAVRQQQNQPYPPRQPPNQGQNNNQIVCSCGQPATKLTVKKQGPNTGRQFYKCASGNCDFFLWDETGNTNNNSTQNERVVRKTRCCGICRQPGHTRNKCPRK